MKKLLILVLMAALLPATGMAMKDMDHSKMEMDPDSKKMDHDSMGMEGMVMLQDNVVDGVKAAAHLMDMEDGMGRMLMVMFTDANSGELISEGQCAIKVESPDQKTSKPQMMMMSKNMFSSGVKLEQKGSYKFTLGTKLADGQKRSFNFDYIHK